MNTQKESHLLRWTVATLIGTGIGLLFVTDKGKEIRSDMKVKAKEIAKNFKKTRGDVQNMVKSIFGKVNEDLEKDYVEIKGHILTEIENQKDKITKDKYEELIDDTVKNFSKAREWSSDSIKKLSKNLKEEWQDLKKDLK